MAPPAAANTADCTHCSILPGGGENFVSILKFGRYIYLEGLAAHDALEAAQVVNVGHGAHHQVVGGEDQPAPVTLHPEYPETIQSSEQLSSKFVFILSRARYY